MRKLFTGARCMAFFNSPMVTSVLYGRKQQLEK